MINLKLLALFFDKRLCQMRKFFYILLISLSFITFACGKHNRKREMLEKIDNDSIPISEDSTVYGLACDGCTDSVVWLLPPDASDPVKYDIVAAHHHRKIFGKIKTGDGIAVVVNPLDSAVADMVIDLELLKGTWCYVVMPELRNAGNLTKKQKAEILSGMPDSIKETFYVPVEYGFTLKRNNLATPVGLSRLIGNVDEENPFVYPSAANYTSWYILNGRIVLSQQLDPLIVPQDSTDFDEEDKMLKHKEPKIKNDTVDIAYLFGDSLALKFKGHTQGYYRKK